MMVLREERAEKGNMDLQTLSSEDILQVHEVLVRDFALTSDPISPPGVRSRALLDSAVSRQLSGARGVLKYPDPVDNAATLTFGLCCDHPFHNGNKRTALVAMLAHLDKNKLALRDVSQSELYDMIVAVADHRLSSSVVASGSRPQADDEVSAIANWISDRLKKVKRGERQITYRDLKRILNKHNFDLSNKNGNYIDIIKLYPVGQKHGGRFKRIWNIPYPGEGHLVGIKLIKTLRAKCGLREEDGVDSNSFYDDEAVLDGFINKYRTVLRRLAKT